jgi:hypothetical protein
MQLGYHFHQVIIIVGAPIVNEYKQAPSHPVNAILVNTSENGPCCAMSCLKRASRQQRHIVIVHLVRQFRSVNIWQSVRIDAVACSKAIKVLRRIELLKESIKPWWASWGGIHRWTARNSLHLSSPRRLGRRVPMRRRCICWQDGCCGRCCCR